MRGRKLATVVALMVLGLSAGLLAVASSDEPEVAVGSTATESTARLDTELVDTELLPVRPAP